MVSSGDSAHPLHRQLNRRGMRLSAGRVLGADACGKVLGQFERAKLLSDAGAASAGHNSQTKLAAEHSQNSPRARQAAAAFRSRRQAAKAIRLDPFCSREPHRAIDAVPIRRIVLFEFRRVPFDFHRAEHFRYTRGRLRRRNRAKCHPNRRESHARRRFYDSHWNRIREERFEDGLEARMKSSSAGLVAHRQNVVALKRKIVEARSVAVPAGSAGFLAANDVRRGQHLHASAAERALDQRDFQFDGGSRRDHAGSKKIDSARADISSDERNRNRLNSFADADQSQRQRQGGARTRRGARWPRRWRASERARIFAVPAFPKTRERIRYGFQIHAAATAMPSPAAQ